MHPTRTTWYFFFLCLIQLFVAAPLQAFLGYVGLVLSQLLLFLLPTVVLAKRRGGVLTFLRLNEVPLSAFFWAFVLSFLAIPVSTFLNGFVIILLESLGMTHYQPIDILETAFHPAIIVLMFSVMPGICEELMFRGFFLRSYAEKLPLSKAIILSSIFFGLIHFNAYNLLSPIYLGVVFSLLVHIYDSVVPAILGHTYFNAIVYYIQLTADLPGETPEALTMQAVLGIFPLALFGAISTGAIFRRLYQSREMPADLIAVGTGTLSSEEMNRKWKGRAEETDESDFPENTSTERYQRIPLSVWLPLFLSVILFVAMAILSEWFIRMGMYV